MMWTKDDKLKVAERLKKIRNKSRLSQEKMAEILNISISAYKKIEKGENNLTIAEIRILKEHFKISSDFLLFGEEENPETIWNKINSYDDSKKLDVLIRLVLLFGNGKL